MQCTREILSEYYTNLVRTNASGKYAIADDDDDSSPMAVQPLKPAVPPQDIAQRPTIEQNMAFAAHQRGEG